MFANYSSKEPNSKTLIIILIALTVLVIYSQQDKTPSARQATEVKILFSEDLEKINVSNFQESNSLEDVEQRIMTVNICTTDGEDCDNPSPYTNNIMIFWEVYNGVGCCNTYDCDYEAFYDDCLDPFNLYEIILDGEDITPQMNNYDYECSETTPYNYVSYDNLSTGLHTLTIKQKDCYSIIDEKSSYFMLLKAGDSYELVH